MGVLLARVSLLAVLLSSLALAEPPPRPFGTFDAAKKVARDAIYADQRTDFYCGCAFTPTKTRSGGTIDATDSGLHAVEEQGAGEGAGLGRALPRNRHPVREPLTVSVTNS